MIDKPESVSSNAFKSAKWDEITNGRSFSASDVPALELLCQWYHVVQRCIDDMTVGEDVQVAYTNATDDIRALPQLATMKQASAEIRALNKQLGINDEPSKKKPIKVSVLQQVVNDRAKKAKRAGA